MLKYKSSYGTTYTIKLQLSTYYDGQLALSALCWDEDLRFWDRYATFTVNLIEVDNIPAPEGCAYLDTNNHPEVEDWLTENGLAEFAGLRKQSGFCTYPLYRLNIEKIKQVIATQEDPVGQMSCEYNDASETLDIYINGQGLLTTLTGITPDVYADYNELHRVLDKELASMDYFVDSDGNLYKYE